MPISKRKEVTEHGRTKPRSTAHKGTLEGISTKGLPCTGEIGKSKPFLPETGRPEAAFKKNLYTHGLNELEVHELVRDEFYQQSEDDQPELGGPFSWEKEE